MWSWIKKEPQGFFATAKLATLIFLCDALITLIVVLAIWGHLEMNTSDGLSAIIIRLFSTHPYISTVGIIILVGLEELVFRGIPILLGVWLSKGNIFVICGICLVSSLLFALAHGGWRNVPIQGLGGLLLCLLYLKCGGISKKVFKPLFTTITTHVMWDFILIAVLMLIYT